MVVYGSPQPLTRKELWFYLANINRDQHLPWLVLGDFNAMLHSTNKKGGVPLTFNDCKPFLHGINDCELIDLLVSGSPFTWHKNNVHEWLDWAFSNLAWLHIWPKSHVAHLARAKSDHCPIFCQD